MRTLNGHVERSKCWQKLIAPFLVRPTRHPRGMPDPKVQKLNAVLKKGFADNLAKFDSISVRGVHCPPLNPPVSTIVKKYAFALPSDKNVAKDP